MFALIKEWKVIKCAFSEDTFKRFLLFTCSFFKKRNFSPLIYTLYFCNLIQKVWLPSKQRVKGWSAPMMVPLWPDLTLRIEAVKGAVTYSPSEWRTPPGLCNVQISRRAPLHCGDTIYSPNVKRLKCLLWLKNRNWLKEPLLKTLSSDFSSDAVWRKRKLEFHSLL